MSEWAMIAFALMFAAFCIEATVKRMWRRGCLRAQQHVIDLRTANDLLREEIGDLHNLSIRAAMVVERATRAVNSVTGTIDEWPETIEEKR